MSSSSEQKKFMLVTNHNGDNGPGSYLIPWPKSIPERDHFVRFTVHDDDVHNAKTPQGKFAKEVHDAYCGGDDDSFWKDLGGEYMGNPYDTTCSHEAKAIAGMMMLFWY